MNKDAILMLAAFIVAAITFNWSDMKIMFAKFKEKFDKSKAAKSNDPQDES